MKKLEIKLTTEMMTGLFEGKRIEQNWHQGDGEITQVVIYPDRYGVFMTHEKAAELRRKIQAETFMEVMGLFEDNKI